MTRVRGCTRWQHLACAQRQRARLEGYIERKFLSLIAVYAALERVKAVRWPRGEEKGVRPRSAW
jgi:hypothetical protein